ncbi:DUF1294 domain-containing protein [Streptococcus dentiloxodontae]
MLSYVLAGLAAWNLFVFCLYGLDKRRAVRGQWRIPEKTLLLMTVCLGGLGALLAGRLFHHKTRKWYFIGSWYAGVILIAVTVYLVWRR